MCQRFRHQRIPLAPALPPIWTLLPRARISRALVFRRVYCLRLASTAAPRLAWMPSTNTFVILPTALASSLRRITKPKAASTGRTFGENTSKREDKKMPTNGPEADMIPEYPKRHVPSGVETATVSASENGMLLGPNSAAGLAARVSRLEHQLAAALKELAKLRAEKFNNPKPALATK